MAHTNKPRVSAPEALSRDWRQQKQPQSAETNQNKTGHRGFNGSISSSPSSQVKRIAPSIGSSMMLLAPMINVLMLVSLTMATSPVDPLFVMTESVSLAGRNTNSSTSIVSSGAIISKNDGISRNQTKDHGQESASKQLEQRKLNVMDPTGTYGQRIHHELIGPIDSLADLIKMPSEQIVEVKVARPGRDSLKTKRQDSMATGRLDGVMASSESTRNHALANGADNRNSDNYSYNHNHNYNNNNSNDNHNSKMNVKAPVRKFLSMAEEMAKSIGESMPVIDTSSVPEIETFGEAQSARTSQARAKSKMEQESDDQQPQQHHQNGQQPRHYHQHHQPQHQHQQSQSQHHQQQVRARNLNWRTINNMDEVDTRELGPLPTVRHIPAREGHNLISTSASSGGPGSNEEQQVALHNSRILKSRGQLDVAPSSGQQQEAASVGGGQGQAIRPAASYGIDVFNDKNTCHKKEHQHEPPHYHNQEQEHPEHQEDHGYRDESEGVQPKLGEESHHQHENGAAFHYGGHKREDEGAPYYDVHDKHERIEEIKFENGNDLEKEKQIQEEHKEKDNNEVKSNGDEEEKKEEEEKPKQKSKGKGKGTGKGKTKSIKERGKGKEDDKEDKEKEQFNIDIQDNPWFSVSNEARSHEADDEQHQKRSEDKAGSSGDQDGASKPEEGEVAAVDHEPKSEYHHDLFEGAPKLEDIERNVKDFIGERSSGGKQEKKKEKKAKKEGKKEEKKETKKEVIEGNGQTGSGGGGTGGGAEHHQEPHKLKKEPLVVEHKHKHQNQHQHQHQHQENHQYHQPKAEHAHAHLHKPQHYEHHEHKHYEQHHHLTLPKHNEQLVEVGKPIVVGHQHEQEEYHGQHEQQELPYQPHHDQQQQHHGHYLGDGYGAFELARHSHEPHHESEHQHQPEHQHEHQAEQHHQGPHDEVHHRIEAEQHQGEHHGLEHQPVVAQSPHYPMEDQQHDQAKGPAVDIEYLHKFQHQRHHGEGSNESPMARHLHDQQQQQQQQHGGPMMAIGPVLMHHEPMGQHEPIEQHPMMGAGSSPGPDEQGGGSSEGGASPLDVINNDADHHDPRQAFPSRPIMEQMMPGAFI